jgi:predicted RNase H-like nuclease
MARFKIYGGNLRTVKLSNEEKASMISVAVYAKRYSYSISSVYYGISQGYIVARKFRGKWRLLPQENNKKKVFI